jgi:signal transduction histidine kinase
MAIARRALAELCGEGVSESTTQHFALQKVDAIPSRPLHGEGIGLSIVKRLCELLDATLEMESETGVGSTMLVIFPRRYQDAERLPG